MISDSKMLPASAILLNQFPGRKHNLFIFLRINGLPLGGAYCLSVHATKQGVATPEHTLLTGLGVAYEGFFLLIARKFIDSYPDYKWASKPNCSSVRGDLQHQLLC